MNDIEENLANFQQSLLTKIPVAGLISRNQVAYKWKAPFRCWMIRELTFWRATDLFSQSYELITSNNALGARILLRSAIETLAMLIYLNMRMQQVVDGTYNFHAFGHETARMLLGTRRPDEERLSAINVLKMIDKADRQYSGMRSIYDDLSESAHPNYDGLLHGYSTTNFKEWETDFSNRWMEQHGESHLDDMRIVMETFHHEYNAVWPNVMDRLEEWITENDEMLEDTKGADQH